MARLVRKFGGTSVADVDRIRNVAAHVKREADSGHACAVVVSAMAGQTNQLVAPVGEAWGFKAGKPKGAPGNRSPTLGRGGSDTSAVALAAALQADRCDIYTDVDGVYTTDPRVVPKAHRLDRISYEEMLEMASQGAKVLQTRSVELAMQKGVRVLVRSSFEPPDLGGKETNAALELGTLVCHEDEIVEQNVVSG